MFCDSGVAGNEQGRISTASGLEASESQERYRIVLMDRFGCD